jgi:hypothetical protein
VWDDLVLVYFEGEVWKQEIEHLGFKAQYSNIDTRSEPTIHLQNTIVCLKWAVLPHLSMHVKPGIDLWVELGAAIL